MCSYDADADAVTSVMALLPLIKGKPTAVVVEVSKATTARLLHSVHGPCVSAVEDLSAKLFVQCCRQPGLVDVYCNLLDHSRECTARPCLCTANSGCALCFLKK